MQLDVIDLKSFYASALGRIAERMVSEAIRRRWQSLDGLAVLGLGYAVPYLDALKDDAERTIAFMPARQGVVAWPAGILSASSLVEASDLPVRDSVFDRILLVHALEMADDAAELMSEIWRVLTPGGHLMIVTPNRRGPWARLDTTPFGHGRPYSRRQLTELLRSALFTPVHWDEALHMPPISSKFILRTASLWERCGVTLASPFAGLHVIEATKQVYRPAVASKAIRVRGLLQPVLVPSGGTAAGRTGDEQTS